MKISHFFLLKIEHSVPVEHKYLYFYFEIEISVIKKEFLEFTHTVVRYLAETERRESREEERELRTFQRHGVLASQNVGPSDESPVAVHSSTEGDLLADFNAHRGEE